MADIPTRELEDLRSSVSQLTEAVTGLTAATSAAAAASKNAADADNQEANASRNNANGVGGALGKLGTSALSTANSVHGLAKTFASIAESGRQFAEKTGATATRGAQFQLDINKILLGDIRKFGADQQVTAEQIKSAGTSFADAFVGAAAGMQISARGTAEFARSLSTGFKSEFTLTAQSMKALVTVGAATTKEFDAFRKASGRAGLSSGQFANLVNKNSLSFMLYGPNFAKAAVNAERLGISLSSVQKAQESMVTNLDGTIDTIAQLNQLGAGIDFGTLVTMAETQGPEATLKYLQSTIPPSLFQSASTRALISKLGIPLEDLLKSQGSVQASAADRIEQAFTEVATPASSTAKSLADLNKNLMAWDENKIMEIMNGLVSVTKSIWNTVTALGAFIISLYTAAAGTVMKGLGGGATTAAAGGSAARGAATASKTFFGGGLKPQFVGSGSNLRMLPAGVSSEVQLAKSLRAATPGMTPAQALTAARAELAGTGYQTYKGSRIGARMTMAGSRIRQIASYDVGAASRRALTSIKAAPRALASAARRGVMAAPGVATSATKGIFARAGAGGIGSGALAGVFGAMEGYNASMQKQIEAQKAQLLETAKKSGKTLTEEDALAAATKSVQLTGRSEAAGAGAVQGGAAAAGAILGAAILPFLGPVGPIVGGFLGNKLGQSINEKFPWVAKSVGDTFSQIKTAVEPLLEKLKELWQTFKGPFFFALKIVGGIVGGTLFLAFKALGFVFSTIIAPVLGFVIDVLKEVGVVWIKMMNFIIRAINSMGKFFGFTIKEIEMPEWTKQGGTTKPVTGKSAAPQLPASGTPAPTAARSTPTTTGTMAAEIATNAVQATTSALPPRGNSSLEKKVDELITVLRDAKTTIQVGNSTEQVPRVAVARVGAYERNGRS